MSLSGPNASKISWRCASESLSRVSSSWLRTNVAQCASFGGCGRSRSASAIGPASPRASDRYMRCMPMKSKHIVSSSPPSPKNSMAVGVGQVDLAEQHALAVAPVEERAQVGEVVVRVGQVRGVGLAGGLDQERHGVDPEARQTQLHPEPDDPGDLVADLRVGDVEVGLELVEAVQVVLAGLLVVLPEAGLLVRERDALAGRRRRLVRPDVPVAVGVVRAERGPAGTTGAGRRCG